MREKNIFYNVLKNETSLTEVFCNLLEYKIFRDLFLKIVNKRRKILQLKEFSLSYTKGKNFSTEKDFGENAECFDADENNKIGRGDLIYEDKNGVEYIFELKVEKYTQLTKNQPKGYLCYLQKENERLFFILPRGYLHINEIYDQWHKETSYSIKNIKNNIIFWEDILNEIRRKELDKINLVIGEFCRILEYNWFDYDDIKFSRYEIKLLFKVHEKKKEGLLMSMDVNMPKIMKKLFNIVENTKVETQTNKNYIHQNPDYYGYFLKDDRIPDEWYIWFGVDFERWEKYNFPLLIQIHSDNEKEMKKIKKLNIPELIVFEDEEPEDDMVFIGIDKKIFENENENISEKFDKKIMALVESISTYREVSV